MRLFFALQLGPEALAAAGRVQEELRAKAGKARLSFGKPEQLHVTLAFLGEQRSAEAALLAGRAAASGAAPFPVALGAASAFPREERPRVLWLGLAEGGEALARLAERLFAELRARGVDPGDKPFHPHVTLARAKPGGEREAAGALARLRGAGGAPHPTFTADRIALVESRFGSGGVVHLPVEQIPLGGG